MAILSEWLQDVFNHSSDSKKWVLNSRSSYTWKSYFLGFFEMDGVFDNSELHDQGYLKAKIPKKVKFFMWVLAQDQLNTLQKSGTKDP